VGPRFLTAVFHFDVLEDRCQATPMMRDANSMSSSGDVLNVAREEG
jgi:hypothetical protein